MNYWLFSTEPDTYPWQKVEQEKRVRWDGIRGFPAQRFMRLIETGDEILAYHSSPEKAVVGIAQAVSASYSDPSVPKEEKDKWHVIDLSWKHWLGHPVPIAVMRKTRALGKMKFLIMPRLSISPVTSQEWDAILQLASPPPPLPTGEGRRQTIAKPSPIGRGGPRDSGVGEAVLQVDAILFDLDGTLVDSKKDIARSVHTLQKKYGRSPSSEADIARFIGDGVVKLVERAVGRKESRELEEAVAYFKAHYRRHALDTTYAYPGVAPTLAHFRGKKMAVVTNKPVRVSKHILQGLGLASYFPVVLGGDSFARKKPHPEGVFQALDQLGVRRTRSVMMVGDSAQDVIAGRAAGTRTCGVISNIGDPLLLQRSSPEYTISSLYDLTRIIS